ncbi:MAG TPA: winged helix-turn-helix domain-containing protein [Steroidobacteraceae bacterium]|nr:winged helix-turn-helix domain-containing protein [Steroidobacteraceae bacterium]
MSAPQYRCGDFLVDLGNRRFLHKGREVALEPRVFAVIAELLKRSHELVTRNELLDTVWGHRYVTPSTLTRLIALARRAFGDDVSEPRYIQTVHGSGYRYVGPVTRADTETQTVRARFEPPFAARLPARIEALIGRETELATLSALLENNRAVTVLGAGGMGKTRCALEAARRAAPGYADGVWFFDLSPVNHASEWLNMLGAALAMPAAAPEALVPQLGALLQDRTALIVLDNCERVAADLGSLVFQLLRATNTLRFLTTSQRPLNLTGEQTLRLPPLRAPASETCADITPEKAGAYAAVQLLLMRIHAALPDFELDGSNAAVLSEISLRLDGMPLALELAAARFTLLSPQQVLERLVQRFRFLESDSAGRDHRHRNLSSLLEWSYSLLSAEEQRLLNWVAVFVQSWSVEAFVALAAALGHEPESAVDLLSGLVSHSLVSVLTDVTPPRYRLLESVREYALLQLQSTLQEKDARTAHLDAMAYVCRKSSEEMLAGRIATHIEQFVLDRGNIVAALETAAALGRDHPQALTIVGSLLLYAKGHGDYMAMFRWCQLVLDPSSESRTQARARALLTLGVVRVYLQFDEPWMAHALADAARIAAEYDDWWTEAYAVGYSALACANEGRPEEAAPYAQRTRAAAERHNDELLRGLAGLAHGWVWLARGQPERALTELYAARDLGCDPHQRHFVGMYLGLAHFALGHYPQAAQVWLASLNVSISLGNVRGIAGSIEGCGYLASVAGDRRTAARLLAVAGVIRERTQLPLFSFWRPHLESTMRALRLHLSPAELEASWQSGAALRHEDATNEAAALLRSYSTAATLPEDQSGVNRPVGS